MKQETRNILGALCMVISALSLFVFAITVPTLLQTQEKLVSERDDALKLVQEFIDEVDSLTTQLADIEAKATTEGEMTATKKAEKPRLSAYEILEATAEVMPSLEAKCPYDLSKCVATTSYSYTNVDWKTTWDVYLYVNDGVIGTWIINDKGNQISFYGDAYENNIENYNVHMGSRVCVYPDGDDGERFIVVTY